MFGVGGEQTALVASMPTEQLAFVEVSQGGEAAERQAGTRKTLWEMIIAQETEKVSLQSRYNEAMPCVYSSLCGKLHRAFQCSANMNFKP